MTRTTSSGSLADARDRVESYLGLTDFRTRSSGECEVGAVCIGTYWFAGSVDEITPHPRPASPGSTTIVETDHPLCSCQAPSRSTHAQPRSDTSSLRDDARAGHRHSRSIQPAADDAARRLSPHPHLARALAERLSDSPAAPTAAATATAAPTAAATATAEPGPAGGARRRRGDRGVGDVRELAERGREVRGRTPERAVPVPVAHPGVPVRLGELPALCRELGEDAGPPLGDPEHDRVGQVPAEQVLALLVLDLVRLRGPQVQLEAAGLRQH